MMHSFAIRNCFASLSPLGQHLLRSAGCLAVLGSAFEISPLIASEQKLLMMRPYQVYQVKNIVQCIHDNCGNGYIWSTTGSGKTLTSFKASTLLKDNPDIVKCLFVVDRKDLDRQTREDWSSSDKTSSKGEARRVSASSANQFNKFQEGCVEEKGTALIRQPRRSLRVRRLHQDYGRERSHTLQRTKPR